MSPIFFILIPIQSKLWRMGGEIDKRWRRMGCAIAQFVPFIAYPVHVYALALSSLALFGATTVPYGDKGKKSAKSLDRYHYAWVFVVGCLYGVAQLPLVSIHGRLTIWLAGTMIQGISFVGLKFLSNKYNKFDWKYVEYATGALNGLFGALLIA